MRAVEGLAPPAPPQDLAPVVRWSLGVAAVVLVVVPVMGMGMGVGVRSPMGWALPPLFSSKGVHREGGEGFVFVAGLGR